MQNTKDTTNPTTSTPDSWESRIEAAATFMGISVKEVLEALAEMGVEKEPAGMEMLSDEGITPFGDIRNVFCDTRNIPIAKVRMAMKYLRGSKDSAKTNTISPEMIKMKEKYGVKPKLENVGSEDLLEDYDPNRSDHPISIVLQKRFGDKAVIVFKPDSTEVDIEATANYIADLDAGFPEQDTVDVNGVLVRIYQVGQVPNQMVEEDPFYEGCPLKRGRSLQNRINWAGIDDETRKFCRIAVEMEEIDPDDKIRVREFMKLASKGLSYNSNTLSLRNTYPEVDLEYRERAQTNDLPKLNLTLQEVNGNGNNNPFNIKNRKY